MKPMSDALKQVNKKIAQNPDDAWAYARRGQLYSQNNQLNEALADFNRALEISPNYAWVLAQRGEIYRAMECFDRAITDFSSNLALDPNNNWALAHRGATHYSRYDRQTNHAQALQDLDKAIQQQPTYAWAIMHRANLYVAMQDYEQALVDIDRSHVLDPTILLPWIGERAMVLNFAGRYDETIAGCQQAVQEDPEEYFAWYSLTVAQNSVYGLQEAQHSLNQAEQVLQKVVTQRPEDGLALYRLAGMAALQEKTELAFTYLEAAIQAHREPRQSAMHDPVWRPFHHLPRYDQLVFEPERPLT